MLKILRIVFTLISCILAIYSITSHSVTVLSFSLFSLGMMFLLIGFSELQEKRRVSSYASILVSVFIISVSIFVFFLLIRIS